MGTTSAYYGKPFAYRQVPDTCRWCGDRLKREFPDWNPGYRGNGKFCSLRCGYQWAVRMAAPADA